MKSRFVSFARNMGALPSSHFVSPTIFMTLKLGVVIQYRDGRLITLIQTTFPAYPRSLHGTSHISSPSNALSSRPHLQVARQVPSFLAVYGFHTFLASFSSFSRCAWRWRRSALRRASVFFVCGFWCQELVLCCGGERTSASSGKTSGRRSVEFGR